MARMGGKTRKRSTTRRHRKKPTLPTVASKLKMLQADLLQSQQEINKLLEKLADVNREKSDMVANVVHMELLRMADERAKRAELRAMTLEQELRHMKQRYHGDIEIYPMVKMYSEYQEDRERGSSHSDGQDTPPSLPPRPFDYTQGYSPHMGNGNRPRNASSPASPHMFRKICEPDNEFDRSRQMNRNHRKSPTEMRSQSKSPKRSARINTNMMRAHSQGGADNNHKVNLTTNRVQTKIEPKVTKSTSNHKTFLDRVHSKFFASKKKDAVTPCDLPDINTLMQYAVKAEYETPTEYMKNYTGTPLIKNNNQRNTRVAESEDSDWSETDDELLEPGIKKAKREKAQQRRKQKQQKDRGRGGHDGSDKTRSSKESGGEQKKDENRMVGGKVEEEEEGGSQKGSTKSNKPPPIAPKPKKSSINNSFSSLNSNDSLTKTNSTDAISQEKMESTESLDGSKTPPTPGSPGSPGREAPISFDEVVPQKPQLKSYRRVHGPQGRRRPQRYSSQAMSQTMSTTLSQIMA